MGLTKSLSGFGLLGLGLRKGGFGGWSGVVGIWGGWGGS